MTQRPGVVVHYAAGFDEKVLWHLHPPRVRLDEAVLDLAADAPSETAVVACLTRAVGDRLTIADRLLAAVEQVGEASVTSTIPTGASSSNSTAGWGTTIRDRGTVTLNGTWTPPSLLNG